MLNQTHNEQNTSKLSWYTTFHLLEWKKSKSLKTQRWQDYRKKWLSLFVGGGGEQCKYINYLNY